MNTKSMNKVAVIVYGTIVLPSLITPLLFPCLVEGNGSLSFISLRSQAIPEKNIKDENQPTAQDLIETLNDKSLGYEFRFNAIDLAKQLPEQEYVHFLKSAIMVHDGDGQIAATAAITLFELDNKLLDDNMTQNILSMAPYGRAMVLIQFIKKAALDNSNTQFSSLSRAFLEQLITESEGNIIQPETNISSEQKEKHQMKLKDVGLSCLLLVTSTFNLTADDHAMLKMARSKFPKELRVWLAGSLAKDIDESDLKSGQSIYTDELVYKPIRVAVALALSPIDPKAEIFYVKSVESLLSTAPKRELDIMTDFDATKLPKLVQFGVELQYISWLRFYNAPNALALTLKCLQSKSHSVMAGGGIVAAKRYPAEMIIVLKNQKNNNNVLIDEEVTNFFALLTLFHPQYFESVQKIVSQDLLLESTDKLKKYGVSAIFNGGGDYLGL